jgi:deoxyribose-phosphate aldolase
MTPDTYEALAQRLDVRLLDPWASSDEVYEACMRASRLGVRAVVVRPSDYELAKQWLSGSGVTVVSVAGYPYGTANTAVKLYELRDLLRLGCREIELTLPAARMTSRQFQHVEAELMQAAKSCHEDGGKLTVLYNSAQLSSDSKIIATKICRRTEVDHIAIDGGEEELTLFRPLLKDVLQLRLAAMLSSLDEVLAALAAGYEVVPTLDAEPILMAWKLRLEEQSKQLPQPVVS